MAPRGRSRKPRLSRMDAAVDAMNPFGFSAQLVRKTVNHLLKVYAAGDEAWRFIEADAYSVLLETILGEQSENQQEEGNQEKLAQGPGENVLMVGPSQDEVGEHEVLPISGSSSGAAAEPICTAINNTTAQTGDRECKEDYHIHEAVGLNETRIVKEELNDGNSPPANSPSHVISPPSVPTRKRRPCYGWISDGEEDEPDFIYLTPAQQFGHLQNLSCGAEEQIRKKKSRWDEKPEFF